jgi:PAS domain-containing protein
MRGRISRTAKLCGGGSIRTTEAGCWRKPRRRYVKEKTIRSRIVLPGGTVKHLEAIGHHLFSANGELVQVLGTNVDVTERKRAERAIRENEYELRQIIEALPGMVWSTKPDGGLTHLSQKVLDYSGLRLPGR